MQLYSRFIHACRIAAAGAAALSGCAISTDVAYEGAPPAEVHLIAVDRVVAETPEWERLARRLRQDLVKALKRDTEDVDIMASVPPRLPPDSLVIGGILEDAETGNELLTTLIGYTVGGAALKARFTVRGSDGARLAEFETTISADDPSAESVYVGGFGTHIRPLYLDDLTKPLADAAAEAVAGWAAGEGLN